MSAVVAAVALELYGCSRAVALATVPRATRVSELANGELLVGDATGGIWRINAFGDVHGVADLPGGPVIDLAADPLGAWWALTADGTVWAATLWASPAPAAEGQALLFRDCEQTRWSRASEAPGITAETLGKECGTVITGTSNGMVGAAHVGDSEIRRVQTVSDGFLWVDATGAAGCVGCGDAFERVDVVDAIELHLAPFVPGDRVWIDRAGVLWIEPG